ncbi:MAG: hypothetical protein Q8R79_01220 [Legionellaceae bacterium]|nr:hypothetical protein [Legionellaceae bacterium]
MKIKKSLKKASYIFTVTLLTLGAGLTLGLLSFTGMYLLFPIVSLAVISLILSSFYESAIYELSVKRALQKLLFKRDYLRRDLSLKFLHTHTPFDPQGELDNALAPEFLKDYYAQLQLVTELQDAAEHAEYEDSATLKQKKAFFHQQYKTLQRMEKVFTSLLYDQKTDYSNNVYLKELQDWAKKQENYKTLHPDTQKRRWLFHAFKIFSVTAGLTVGAGTFILLIIAFATIPMLAVLPFEVGIFIILGMAPIAALAYSFLIYNAITDMVQNKTIQRLLQNIRQYGSTPENILRAIGAFLILGLTIALTVCTAGTWWTIIDGTGLFEKAVSVCAAVINFISSLVFNVQNSCETLQEMDPPFWKRVWNKIKGFKQNFKDWYEHLSEHEPLLQRLNPFRLLLLITIQPLRIILFLGHLISIGVATNELPGLDPVIASILGILSELFEDYHWFFGHMHDHHKKTAKELISNAAFQNTGHSHSSLPENVIKICCLPIYLLAATWDSIFGKTRFIDSLSKFTKWSIFYKMESFFSSKPIKKPTSSCGHDHAGTCTSTTQPSASVTQSLQPGASVTETPQPTLSKTWKKEELVHRLTRFEEKQWGSLSVEKETIKEKKAVFSDLKAKIREATDTESCKAAITEAAKDVHIRQPRHLHFFKSTAAQKPLAADTESSCFLSDLAKEMPALG